ncbi:hypothetical protein ASG14_16435 [Pedobacter sp. Leaf194]|nr:hypothetical protein ASG14_16435 [Pedobacter sp. Leaf194]
MSISINFIYQAKYFSHPQAHFKSINTDIDVIFRSKSLLEIESQASALVGRFVKRFQDVVIENRGAFSALNLIKDGLRKQ